MTAEKLQRLRSDARLERDTELERRVRGGEDPATAFAEVPEIDELVVLALRDELLEGRGLLAEFSLARLAARSGSDGAAAIRQEADRLEFEVLREIAAAAPELTVAVWGAGRHLKVN